MINYRPILILNLGPTSTLDLKPNSDTSQKLTLTPKLRPKLDTTPKILPQFFTWDLTLKLRFDLDLTRNSGAEFGINLNLGKKN